MELSLKNKGTIKKCIFCGKPIQLIMGEKGVCKACFPDKKSRAKCINCGKIHILDKENCITKIHPNIKILIPKQGTLSILINACNNCDPDHKVIDIFPEIHKLCL